MRYHHTVLRHVRQGADKFTGQPATRAVVSANIVGHELSSSIAAWVEDKSSSRMIVKYVIAGGSAGKDSADADTKLMASHGLSQCDATRAQYKRR